MKTTGSSPIKPPVNWPFTACRRRVSCSVVLISVFLSFGFPGCTTKQAEFDKTDSERIDTLIKTRKINERTILVSFGFDAVTAINTGEGIVVVDAGISQALTEKYRTIIEKEFSGDDIAYVINTHGHHDHMGGNGAFPKAEIIGHENCQIEASDRWSDPEKSLIRFSRLAGEYEQKLNLPAQNSADWIENYTQKIRCLSACLDAKNQVMASFPEVTFTDSLTLDLGDTVFEMVYFGRFHSESDIIIYVPETRILFTGDLFSKYGRPGINEKLERDEDRLVMAINWIGKRLDTIEAVIAGHGEVLSVDDLRKFMNRYLSNDQNAI